MSERPHKTFMGGQPNVRTAPYSLHGGQPSARFARKRAGLRVTLTFAGPPVTVEREMATLADVFRELNVLRERGVIQDYAVGGAMAMLFWAEPILTFDLDIFVVLPPASSAIVSLEPLYAALHERGFESVAEHVMIHQTPVQFLPSPNELADEAIDTAEARELDGVPFRIMRPEYLIALWLQAGGTKRRERVEVLKQAGVVDEGRLQTILRKFGVGR